MRYSFYRIIGKDGVFDMNLSIFGKFEVFSKIVRYVAACTKEIAGELVIRILKIMLIDNKVL